MDDSTNPNNQKTILLVDDEQFILVAYKEGLEHAGFRVIVAHDGQEALDAVKANLPDLILLDLIMPRVSGFEVLQKLKHNKKHSKIPVIVLTNLSQDSDEQEVRSYGVSDFMIKANVSLKDVLERINQLIVTQT